MSTRFADGLPQGIVDAHHHLWDPVSGASGLKYGWLKDIGAPKPFGDPTPIQRDYLFDELAADWAPFSPVGSVHVQADGGIDDPVAETAFIQCVSDETGFPVMIVGFCDLTRDDAESVMTGHKAYANFRGVRQIISYLQDRPDISFAPRNLPDDPQWRANFGLLAKHGLSFDLQLYPQQMAQMAEFLSDHPGVPVIIDHAGSPYDQSADGLALWRSGLARLAALPQVHIKISGLGMFDPAWTWASVDPLVRIMLELFGSERTMFGSNFPVDKLFGPYANTVPDLGPQVLRETARRVYRFG